MLCVVVCWSLFVGCWVLIVGCWLLFVVYGILSVIGRYLLRFCSCVACCCYRLDDGGLCVLLVDVCGV